MVCSMSIRLEEVAPVWNSTFKIIEAPMSYTNKLLNIHGRWHNIISSSPVTRRDLSNAFDQVVFGLKKFNFTEMKLGAICFGGKLQTLSSHLYDKKIIILATAGQVVAYPISCIFTPITAIADIFFGVIQAMFRACQGASKNEIQSILHKKVIAAPVQQLAYTINNFVIFGPIFLVLAKNAAIVTAFVTASIGFIGVCSPFLGLSLSERITVVISAIPEIFASDFKSAMYEGAIKVILIHSFLLGDMMYRDAQTMISKLPKFFIPDGYNIFIEGGALDEFGDNAFDPEKEYAEFKDQSQTNTERPYSEYFKASMQEDLKAVNEKDPTLKELHDWFINNQEPYTLFGFESKDKVNESELKTSYKRLALITHPDKHPGNSNREAEILFKVLNTAREDVEKKIIKK